MSDRNERLVNRAADGVAWLIAGVTAGTAAIALASAVLVVALGGEFLLGIKRGLFLGGWLSMAAGAWLLRPKGYEELADDGEDEDEDSPSRDGTGGAVPRRADGRVEPGAVEGPAADYHPAELVQSVPPACWRTVPEEDRLPPGARLVVVGAGMLALSFLMEVAGVGIGVG